MALWDQGAAVGGAQVTTRAAGSPECDTDGLPLRSGRRSPGDPPEAGQARAPPIAGLNQ
ncbi:hypothetical protein [Amycolatopsis lexingtonensis]|uniref:hypothetical protein n=1 Tax=Amycolatopsis lexingtonensis TaxID=218822 RepID=UPI003F71718F